MVSIDVSPAPARADVANTGKPDTASPMVVVFGNEKGGSGKSTCAMHLIVGLLRVGHTVGSIDLDTRQQTLTRYLANRSATIARESLPLPRPRHIALTRNDLTDRELAEPAEQADFEAAVRTLGAQSSFLVIDCAGTDSFLGRLAIAHADKLITPINDSFVDFDLLATVDPESITVTRPSIYAELVWEQRKTRAMRFRRSIDWIVMRNRLSNLNARNKMEMARVLENLSGRVGFRVAPGFSERVIYRELFLRGLTILDLFEIEAVEPRRLSHIAARQEVRDLLNALQLPEPAKAGQSD